jgi:hypothetical protein
MTIPNGAAVLLLSALMCWPTATLAEGSWNLKSRLCAVTGVGVDSILHHYFDNPPELPDFRSILREGVLAQSGCAWGSSTLPSSGPPAINFVLDVQIQKASDVDPSMVVTMMLLAREYPMDEPGKPPTELLHFTTSDPVTVFWRPGGIDEPISNGVRQLVARLLSR